MLVLTRKPGEQVHVGSNVVITVLSITRHRARIGIEAPAEVAVHREEIRALENPEVITTIPGPPSQPR